MVYSIHSKCKIQSCCFNRVYYLVPIAAGKRLFPKWAFLLRGALYLPPEGSKVRWWLSRCVISCAIVVRIMQWPYCWAESGETRYSGSHVENVCEAEAVRTLTHESWCWWVMSQKHLKKVSPRFWSVWFRIYGNDSYCFSHLVFGQDVPWRVALTL